MQIEAIRQVKPRNANLPVAAGEFRDAIPENGVPSSRSQLKNLA